MEELTDAQKARHAIREFKTITDALALRGFYRLSGKLGRELETCLRNLSPEIYGSMNDPRIVELKGLEYVLDRLPRGIEEASRIFATLGFTVADGPDIETTYRNFEALNTPNHHPSLDQQDTLWLDSEYLLRTQTSPVQIRGMENQPPPVRIITPLS